MVESDSASHAFALKQLKEASQLFLDVGDRSITKVIAIKIVYDFHAAGTDKAPKRFLVEFSKHFTLGTVTHGPGLIQKNF